MIAACIYYLIICFVLIKQVKTSTFNPASLKAFSLRSIEKGFESDSVKIIKRLRPHFFDEKVSLTHSGFRNVFSMKHPFPEKKIDLSNLDIEGISIALVKQMPNIEKLDLSNNKRLKLDEEWFYLFSKKLKKLILKNCDLNEDNLKAISTLESLEKLDISECKNFNINSLDFTTILKKLKHLNISNCELDGKALETIYLNAPKLGYLDFSSNNLSNFSFTKQNPFPVFKETLKQLKLIDCGLKSHDLEKFFIFNNLEEVNLSNNDFSGIDESTVEKLFSFTNKKIQTYSYESVIPVQIIPSDLNQLFADEKAEIYTSQLKVVELNGCEITSELFVTKLFDFENLESLRISYCKAQFNFDQIQKGRAYKKLKIFEVISCEGLTSENLKSLTNFPNLETLDASENNFENLPFSFEFGCSKNSLKELILTDSNLNINGLTAITKCRKLEILNVSNNNFAGIGDNFEFGYLKESLKKFYASRSSLNLFALKKIAEFIRLQFLDFRNNNLNRKNTETMEIIKQFSHSLKYLS